VTTVVIAGRYGYRISEGITVMLLNYKATVGVETFTAVAMNSTVFHSCGYEQYCLLGFRIHPSFGGTYAGSKIH
jgi:hypothetical protein